MTFGEHLEDLRSRLIKSLYVLLGVLLVLMMIEFYNHQLLILVMRPHYWAMEKLGIATGTPNIIALSYAKMVLARITLVFIVALFVCSPWIGLQMWLFVSAGLYRKERKYVTLFAPISFFLFVTGCVFGYFVLVPYGLFGLASMMPQKQVSLIFSLPEYLKLVVALTLVLGAVFQVPLLMTFTSKVGLIQPSTFNRWRKKAIIGNAVLAALITPADVLTMLLVMIPLMVLYEIGVISSYLAARHRPAASTA